MTAVGCSSTGQPVSPADPSGSTLADARDTLFSALVADEQTLLREAITARLSSMGAGTVHEAASVTEARACAKASGPCDLAILGLTLPGGGVLDLLAQLRAQGWPRVAVVASADNPQSVRQAIQSGAHAYLLKSTQQSSLAGGGRPAGGDSASGTRVPAADNTLRNLSGREVEVLQLVADGQSNKEIGETLDLSALTVKSHLSRIGRKLGTGDRAQMVALAMRAGVIR